MVDSDDYRIMSWDDLFPFTCKNPRCSAQYNQDNFKELINRRGLVYAEYGPYIYLGMTCEECDWTTLKRLKKDLSIVDLTKSIMIPDPDNIMEIAQQIIEQESRTKKNKSLCFQYVSAWDNKAIEHEEMKSRYDHFVKRLMENIHVASWTHAEPGLKYNESIPYSFSSQEEIERRIRRESDTGIISLRRLYPDIPKFRYLASCLSHFTIAKISDTPESLLEYHENEGNLDLLAESLEQNGKISCTYAHSEEEIKERNRWWRELLEEVSGKSFRQSTIDLLRSKGVETYEEKRFGEILSSILEELHYDEAERIRCITKKIGFEKTIWQYLKKVFDDILHKVCTEVALDPKRQKLRKWIKVKKGEALLVDAPMGLGKTYSIVEVLAENIDLSAVIFMPSLKMCEEIIEQLKTKIAKRKSIYNRKRLDKENIEEAEEKDRSVILDKYGFPVIKWKREFLQDEVYFVDGRNENDCIRFKKFKEIYSGGFGQKSKICQGCKLLGNCRFLKHEDFAKRARIVITTHAQYDRFYNRAPLQYWYKEEGKTNNGNKEKTIKKRKRDVFIVDEDMILSNCYQPKAITYNDLEVFIKRFNEFLEDFDGSSEIIEKIDTFFGKVTRCDENTVIPPIDRDFSLPGDLLKEWKEELVAEYDLMSEGFADIYHTGDYSEFLAHAIKVGAVVEKYDQREAPYEERNKIYFANPKAYDLSELPPHVFLDGTMLDEKFWKWKIKNVEPKPMELEDKSEPLWQLKVWQNKNTDLPKKTIKEDEDNVKIFVRKLISRFEEEDREHKYFFLMAKHTRERYLENFLKEEFPNLKPVLCHYRDMKGINDAKDCDIGVMLGSYIIPIAAEFAMALEFVQDKISEEQGNIRLNETYSWVERNSRRRFKEDYKIVGELADALRLSEHKQGIARTRYIFHDVDFYVLSKDMVKDYEPIAEIKTDQLEVDLFRPRKERSDSEYVNVKEDVYEWLSKHDFAKIIDIRIVTGLGRRIVRKHLYRMVNEELLDKIGTKYKYPNVEKQIIFNEKASGALNRQSIIDQYGFPFTLNPNIGCFFGCKYCYSPGFMSIPRERFFKEVKVKIRLPETLDYELNVYRDLPQHLKRVQINESCESYLLQVMKKTKKVLNRDLVLEILQVFEKHWQEGNQWMLHIITKSHLICRHIEALLRMKEMVQVEVSFACLKEKLRRKIERYAPSIEKRLRAVKQLSDAGVFVRIMAMPFVATKKEGEELREIAFNRGAKAYKHKGLNYYGRNDLLKDKIRWRDRRKDFVYEDLIVNSGEFVIEDGKPKRVRLLMPEKWKTRNLNDWKDKLVEKDVEVIRCGYSECNDVDWGYII